MIEARVDPVFRIDMSSVPEIEYTIWGLDKMIKTVIYLLKVVLYSCSSSPVSLSIKRTELSKQETRSPWPSRVNHTDIIGSIHQPDIEKKE